MMAPLIILVTLGIAVSIMLLLLGADPESGDGGEQTPPTQEQPADRKMV
jgi:hypothetical protein